MEISLKDFLNKWANEYREKWLNSPYGGPAEPKPSDVEDIVGEFIAAYEEYDGKTAMRRRVS